MKFLRRSERRDDRSDGHGTDLAVDDPDMEAVELELQQLKSRKPAALPAPEPHNRDEPLDLHDRHARANHHHDKRRDKHADGRHDRHRVHDDHDAHADAHDDLVIDHELHEDHDPHAPRTLKSKVFGIGFSGYFQLVVLCIAAGAVLEAGGINPFAPGFGFESVLTGLGTGLMTALNWALQYGLWPLVIGAIVVLPLWLFWRLLTVPFRH